MLDILYALSVLILLFFGISLMANGWSLMTKREWKESHEKLPDDMSKEIEGSTHPEMQDIKPGEELIVVRFNKPELDSLVLSDLSLYDISKYAKVEWPI